MTYNYYILISSAIQFSIQLGSVFLTNSDPNRLTVSALRSIVHPDYDPLTLNNDIGIIYLNLPITLNSTGYSN